jgi:CRP-like cAMP-binding protein
MILIMSPLQDMFMSLPAVPMMFGPGEFLFHQGDDVKYVHLVQSGGVHLLRHQPGGASLVMQRAPAGSVLAEASIFSGQFHCDAIAISETRTWPVKAAVVRAQLRSSQQFREQWLLHLSAEVQAARLRAEILSLKTVAERLDAWAASHGGALPAKGEQKMAAAEIGVTPEAFYSEMARRTFKHS